MGIVLIVDDEPLLRLLGSDIAQEAGHEAIEAETADEALGILQSRDDVRLVFTDIKMPGEIDGVELANQIHRRWPSIEVIVSSGRQTPPDSELPPGCRFIEKPFDPDELATLMLDLLQAKPA